MESKPPRAILGGHPLVFTTEMATFNANPYTCAECDWQYVWTMGDRVKALKRHQLAHLLKQRERPDRSDAEVAAQRLAEYLDERLRAVRWL
jgi:hypothetical protein